MSCITSCISRGSWNPLMVNALLVLCGKVENIVGLCCHFCYQEKRCIWILTQFFFYLFLFICRLQYLLPELCRNIDLEFLDISLGSVFMVFQISTAINYWEQATSAFPFSVVNMMYFVRYPYHNLNQASIFYGKHASFISQLAWKVDLWIQRPLLLLGVLWLANSKAMENNKL